MDSFLAFTIIGLVTGALYAVAASGLVVTYTTSGIFNFAHGALGMLAAFCYWQLRVGWGWPAPVALVVVLAVGAPVTGALIERIIMRGLAEVSEVVKLVVSVALLFGVYQLALIGFPADVGRKLPGFFDGHTIGLGFYDLSWHEATILVAAAATAVGLRLVLFTTRRGIAMRAVVDDRSLVRLDGGGPEKIAMTSWALGTTLAALAGILLAGSQGALGHVPLTLLVINAYGAAMFGRLRSLTATFLGAMALGLAQSYAIGYLDLGTPVRSVLGHTFSAPLSLTGVRPAIPIVTLFLVLLFLPSIRLRAGAQVRSRKVAPSPDPRRWLVTTVGLAAAAFLYATVCSPLLTFQLGQGLALAIVMLSMVPLTGYAGQISLAPMAFAGIGAVAMGHWGPHGEPLALLAATGVTALAGALVALPAIRLRGLYLALATAAFAVLMDQLVFNQNLILPNGSLDVVRPRLFGLDFVDDRSYLVFLAVVFGLLATGVVWLRRGRLGRRLLALESSETAAATLGMDLARTKLGVFTLSAAIAGLGGALYGGQLGSISPPTFQFLQSLPVVLLAVVGGIAAVGGALTGGILYACTFLIVPGVAPWTTDILALTPALAGIGLGHDPNGVAVQVPAEGRSLLDRIRRRPGDTDTRDGVETAGLGNLATAGLDGFSTAQLRALDRALHLPVRHTRHDSDGPGVEAR